MKAPYAVIQKKINPCLDKTYIKRAGVSFLPKTSTPITSKPVTVDLTVHMQKYKNVF